MTTAARQRLARGLAEALAVDIDGGLGQLAVAAIAAVPRGPARDVEVARWVRRALRSGERIATLLRPDMTDDEYTATVDFATALAEASP